LNVLYGGLGIGIHPKMLDPDPNQMNTDPKHWLKTVRYFLSAKSSFFAGRTKNSCLKVDGNGATLDIRMSVGVVDHVGNLFRSQPLGPTHGEIIRQICQVKEKNSTSFFYIAYALYIAFFSGEIVQKSMKTAIEEIRNFNIPHSVHQGPRERTCFYPPPFGTRSTIEELL
jgi:hypothetical protein